MNYEFDAEKVKPNCKEKKMNGQNTPVNKAEMVLNQNVKE